MFTPFTREGKPVGAFELASGSGHGDGDDDGLDGIKALSRLGDYDPFGLSPFHLHALIRSTIRGAEGDTDDRWSERDRKRAAERALAALGERWRAGAAEDRLLLSGCLRQGLALARDFALEPGWLTDAARVYVGDSVWEPLAPPTRNDADGMRSTAAACPTTAADTKRRPCG
ncbi:hypothetical protein [Streptomyces sp. NPDC059943]|uniref:hypothetical protein n=1 Tax=Streptomyces sp. NPDC059943 TaxID=3347010 RepID=UPI0036525A1B